MAFSSFLISLIRILFAKLLQEVSLSPQIQTTLLWKILDYPCHVSKAMLILLESEHTSRCFFVAWQIGWQFLDKGSGVMNDAHDTYAHFFEVILCIFVNLCCFFMLVIFCKNL